MNQVILKVTDCFEIWHENLLKACKHKIPLICKPLKFSSFMFLETPFLLYDTAISTEYNKNNSKISTQYTNTAIINKL